MIVVGFDDYPTDYPPHVTRAFTIETNLLHQLTSINYHDSFINLLRTNINEQKVCCNQLKRQQTTKVIIKKIIG